MPKPRNPPEKYTCYFTCMLYVNEDPKHDAMFIWLKNHYDCMYIIHDKDIDEQGNLKKSHMHLVYKTPQRSRSSSQIKFFGGWINHIEAVGDIFSLGLYFIHDTPDSMNKYRYSWDEIVFCGDTFKSICKPFYSTDDIREQYIQLLTAVRNNRMICSADVLLTAYEISPDLYDYLQGHGSWVHQAIRDNQFILKYLNTAVLKQMED